MKVSIAVVTCNRAGLLERCLESVFSQRTAVSYETIVIDNGSLPSEWHRIRERYEKDANLVRLEQRTSLAQCKERALACASGEIIAFTDDDCCLGQGWLSCLTESLKDADIVAGPVYPLGEVTFPWWWQHSVEWLVGIETAPSVTFTPLGSNVAFKRKAFARLEERMRQLRRRHECLLPYAEDIVRLGEAAQLGFTTRIDPRMVVYHSIPPSRLTLSYLIERSIRDGAAWAAWEHTPFRLLRAVMKIVANPVRFALTGDCNRLFRTIAELSYVAHYAYA